MSEEKKEDIKNDLEKDSIQKDTDATAEASSTDESNTSKDDSSVNTEPSKDNDTNQVEDKDQNQEQEQNQEQDDNSQKDEIDEELLAKLDSTFKKTNENLISLEKQELGSLKIPKQSFYKKRAIYLKDNTEKINSAFKYLVYLNRRKNKAQ